MIPPEPSTLAPAKGSPDEPARPVMLMRLGLLLIVVGLGLWGAMYLYHSTTPLGAAGFTSMARAGIFTIAVAGVILLGIAWDRISLTTWIFIGLVLGILYGWLAPGFARELRPLGKLFLTLIKLVVSPLVFATLVVGIAGAGGKHFGRLFAKSMIWFTAATLVALTIGLITVNVVQPGRGVKPSAPSATSVHADEAPKVEKPRNFAETVIASVPTSIIDAMARNDVLQVVVFSVLFGLALASIGERAQPIVRGCQALSDAMFAITGTIMKMAPLGVGGAMAAALGDKGLSLLVTLLKMVLSLYAALIVFVTLLFIAVKIVTRINLGVVLRTIREPLLLAFSTTSSEAALPKAMEAMQRLGVPKHIVAFVMPTGYSFNLDGTTLYLSLASIFVAQVAGVHMTLSQQLVMMLTLMLTSKGVAAMPRASLVVLSATVAAFNLPVEPIFLILGIDEVMDMARTSVNVLGNCLATAVVAKWEGLLPADAPLYGKTPLPALVDPRAPVIALEHAA